MLPQLSVCVSVAEHVTFLPFLESLAKQKHSNLGLHVLDIPQAPFVWELYPLGLFSKYPRYHANVGTGSHWLNLHEQIFTCPNDFILFVDQRVTFAHSDVLQKVHEKLVSNKTIGALYYAHPDLGICFFMARTRVMREIGGFDVNYKTVNPYAFIEALEKMKLRSYDTKTVESNQFIINNVPYINDEANALDKKRYDDKSSHPLYGKDIVYIDGALGDHVCAIPLVRKSVGSYICCKFPQVFNGINTIAGFVPWTHELFGGAGYNMYGFGNTHDIQSLKESFCFMYNRPYREDDFTATVGEENKRVLTERLSGKKVVVIHPTASVQNGEQSNKNWSETRWFEVIAFLRHYGYYVVQVGTKKDYQIPNVDEHFLDADIEDVKALLSISEFWIAVESFVHHMGSAIGKKGICLTPWFNNHAYHNGNIYIAKNSGVDYKSRRWNIDSQQPERKDSMMLITVDEVKDAVLDMIGDSFFLPLTNEWMRHYQEMASQVPSEITKLQREAAKKCPSIIVEIGTANGGTLGRWLQIPNVKKVVTIDLPNGIHGGVISDTRSSVVANADAQARQYGIELVDLTGDSHEADTLTRLHQALNGAKADVLFIDGDHTYDGVKHDFEMYAPVAVREGGLVAFHDILASEYHYAHGSYVDFFWSKCKAYFPHKEWIDKQGSIELWPHTAPYGFAGIGCITYDSVSVNTFLSEVDKPRTVSVIIGAYNNSEQTKQCLESIFAAESANHSILQQIFVHSNGSTDDTMDMLSSMSQVDKRIIPIATDHPIGYARAVNYPLPWTTGNYIVFLNNDTRVGGNWVDRIVNQLDKEPKTGLGGALKGVGYQWSEEDNAKDIAIEPYIFGFFYVVKRSVIEQTGALDESFLYGYHEDEEFCKRVVNAGYELYGASSQDSFDYPIEHYGGQTFSKLEELQMIQAKNHGKWLFYNRSKTKRYCIIPDTAQYAIDTVNHLLAEDSDCIICIVVPTQQMTSELHYNADFAPTLYSDNVHLIPALLTKNTVRNMRAIGEYFFGTKDILYCYNENTDNPIDVTWMAKFDDHSSMGVLSMKTIEHLPDNVNISMKSIIGESTSKNGLVQYMLRRKPSHDAIGVMFSYPDQHKELDGYRMKVIYTGADTSGGIPHFAENANKADALFTPSNLSRSHMKALGVTKPIFVVPHGVDPEIFSYKERDHRPVNFTFLYVGECSDRKGSFQLVDAFIQQFGNAKNVQLVLMSNLDMTFYGSEQLRQKISSVDNIKLIQHNVTQEEIAQAMREAHCYVYPSRADTFGMTALEAMATGLPVIATPRLGVSEFIQGRFIPVDSRHVEVKGHPWMLGWWQEADVNDLANQMRLVKENISVNLDKAKENAEFVRTEMNWDDIAHKLADGPLRILNQNVRKKKIAVLMTSYKRPEYLLDTVQSLLAIEKTESEYAYDIHVVEQSEELQSSIVHALMDSGLIEKVHLHVSPINLGQRGAVNKLHEEGALDGVDYVCFTDQDNEFNKPLSTYCKMLSKYPDCYFATGYVSKEHHINDMLVTKEFGTVLRKSGARAGHMVMRISDVMTMMPMPLDLMYNHPEINGSPMVALDWSLQYWHPKSPGANGKTKFVYALPNGVEHVGYSSTWHETQIEEILRCEVSQDRQLVMSEQVDVKAVQALHEIGIDEKYK